MKDWIGDKNSVYKMLASSNHSTSERQSEDYYATEPLAGELLLKIENIDKEKPIWECASGENHLAKVFQNNGYIVRTSDLIKRTDTTEVLDFLNQNEKWDGTIITNPPYKFATQFVEKSIETVTEGNKVIFFLKIQFLEGKARKLLFQKYPPKTIYVSSSRLNCAKNGDFKTQDHNGAVAYAWFVWEKGYKGETIIKWFN